MHRQETCARKLQILNAIQLTMTQFCEHTTLHGYKYLIEKRRHPVERYVADIYNLFYNCNCTLFITAIHIVLCVYSFRFVWMIFLICTVVMASYISFTSINEHVEKPTVTSLQSQRYPIWEVPFPAVCICTINRISKRAARGYAQEL